MEEEISKLRDKIIKLKRGYVLHKSQKLNKHCFHSFDNDFIRYEVPNLNDSLHPYRKSISFGYTAIVLKILLTDKMVLKKDLMFHDCRVGALVGLLKLLYGEKIKSTKFKIEYVN